MGPNNIGKLTSAWRYRGWVPCLSRLPGTTLYMTKLTGVHFQSDQSMVRCHSLCRVRWP